MGKRHVLLVGVSRYAHYPQLRTPTTNTRKLADVLQKNQQALSSNDPHYLNIEELQDPDLTTLRGKLSELLSGKSKDDMVLFYFTGHGDLLEHQDTLVLCTVDSRLTDKRGYSLNVTELKSWFDGCTAEQIVLILDCCQSEGAKGAVAMGPERELVHMIENNLAGGKGKFVISSSRTWQKSYELDRDDCSLFTKWFIHGLTNFRADETSRGAITLLEAFTYAKTRTVEEARKEGRAQEPTYKIFDGSGGDIRLCIRPGKSISPRPTPPQIEGIPEDALAFLKSVLSEPVVPILGPGIYGSGPLSDFQVCEDLVKEYGKTYVKPKGDASSLTEHAEACVTSFDRPFLRAKLRDILAAHSKETKPFVTHELIRTFDQAPLLVSFTLDLTLEFSLAAAGIPFTLVSHVVAGRPSEIGKLFCGTVHDHKYSKKLINHDDISIEPEPGRRIIYKVMGSPILDRMFGPEAPQPDTLVVTESDYVMFQSRLQSQAIRIPEAFSAQLLFARKLFLGYKMDSWNYRFAASLLQWFKPTDGQPSVVAVRETGSTLEKNYWLKKIGAMLLPMSVETFSRWALELLREPREAP